MKGMGKWKIGKQKKWKGSGKEASAQGEFKVQEITNSTQPLQLYRSVLYLISILHSYVSYANILFTCFLTFGEIAFPIPISKLHQSKTQVGWQQLLPLQPWNLQSIFIMSSPFNRMMTQITFQYLWFLLKLCNVQC